MASAVSHSPQAQAAQSKPPAPKADQGQDRVVLSEAAKAAAKAGGDSDQDGD
jgi:hypothetical protein